MNDANTGGREPARLEFKPPAKPLFRLGQILATPAALAALERLGVTPLDLVLSRHVIGDWGDLCDADRELNMHSIAHGMRIFSSYKLTATTGDSTSNETVWVITEADRTSTTILLPGCY